MNEIGVANIWTARPIAFEPYEASRALGGFILIDPISAATVAAGLIQFALRRSENVHEQALAVTPARRAGLKQQRPKLLWFTGLSGAGKSTIANLVEAKLHARGRHTFLLDGDNIRLGLNKDLGFTAADRVENIRRAGEAAKLMMDAGLIVLTAFISPFRAERAMVRGLVAEGDFIEIFVDTPLAEAERRDTKGLYKKARAGQLANFTGVEFALRGAGGGRDPDRHDDDGRRGCCRPHRPPSRGRTKLIEMPAPCPSSGPLTRALRPGYFRSKASGGRTCGSRASAAGRPGFISRYR